MKLDKIVGKTVIAVKSYAKSGEKYREPSFVLFDDEKTILELSEQDYYSYHDCSQSARNLCVYEDADRWRNIKDNLADANSFF